MSDQAVFQDARLPVEQRVDVAVALARLRMRSERTRIDDLARCGTHLY